MRLVVGMVLVARGVATLKTGALFEAASAEIIAMIAGLLLIAGLWTPVSGLALALVQLWSVVMRPGDPWTSVLLGTVGAALALVGPGAWSVDARRFGWKRIDIRKQHDHNGPH